MSNFYFNSSLNGEVPDEPESIELRDRAEVWSHAVRACGEMLADIDGHLAPNSQGRLWVTDDKGDLVAEITVSTVYKLD
jgi:hypothetical protein